MRNINYSHRQQGKLGLLNNLPKEVLSKLSISNSFLSSEMENEIEVVIISGDNVDNIAQFVDNLGGEYLNLGYNFGIVTIPVDKLVTLALNPKIQYIELPKNLYTTDFNSNRASCITQISKENDLNGTGIIIGFLDTGIDYTHPAFRNEDGTTRIEYIYDLSLDGAIYSKEQINEALKSTDPYSVVPSRDDVGHGTHVAGIATAGGNIESKYYGVAPNSSIIMVKVARTRFALSTQILKGIRFLIDKSNELNMPLVINMSLSTNDGAHNGSSLLEQYISTVSTVERVTIVIAAGNEGDAAHHVGGKIESTNEIYFNISTDERIVVLNIYKSILPDFTLELVCPCGISSGIIEISEEVKSGTIGRSRYEVYVTGPRPFDVSGEIGVVLTGINEYISPGQWKITLSMTNEYEGTYDIWLPISEGLNVNTKFLNPTIYNTLGIPATVQNVISVGSYNYLTNTISSFSGRGKEYMGQYIKPDLVAPGEGIFSSIPNRSFDRKTGTSMATPHVSGIAALMMQWGIVKSNDPYLYGERLKYYLDIGAKKGRRDIQYPDPSWGYGEVCLLDSLRLVSSNLGLALRQQNPTNNEENDEEIALGVRVSSRQNLQSLLKELNVEGVSLTDTVGVLIVTPEQIERLNSLGIEILKEELEIIYTLNEITPIDASGSEQFNNNPYLKLNGRGVLIGILDTGIDYLNEEFTREDDTSRIFRLWDQTIEGTEAVEDLVYGTEYTEEQITEAIKLQKNGGDPYSIVPSRDTIGHGTMVAGIAGGRGKNPKLRGAAPDCEFVVVKLDQASKYELDQAYINSTTPSFTSWKIILAIRYLTNIASRYKKPMVIYFPLGTNLGSHEGTSSISGDIYSYTGRTGIEFVITTGNQGNTETHTEGKISESENIKDIELIVGKNQKRLPMEIWINQGNIVTLSIVSPAGEIIKDINSKLSKNQRIKFFNEQTEMIIDYISPESQTGDSLIVIKADNLKPGIWKFRLTGSIISTGEYYAWIPQRELIEADTKFLQPSSYTTLTVPSTAQLGLSVAFYNQENESVVGASGRGYTRKGRIKPEIAAGGVNALVITPGGGTRVVTGASIAGAVVAGGCALILQWAIVLGNDLEINDKKIRAYIVGGAKKRKGDIYPNREWGFGTFDLEGTFNVIKNIFAADSTRKIQYKEFNIGDLFIRIPKDIN